MTQPENPRPPISILHRAFCLEPGEGKRVLLAAAWFFLLMAGYSVLRPIREDMGVAGGVRNIPHLFSMTFLVSLAISPAFAWVTARLPRRVFVPWTYRAVGLSLIGFWALWQSSDEAGRLWLGRVFYVWVSVFNLFVVSVLWSVLTDLFPPERAKRCFGPIAIGATLGAICGSAATALSAELLGTAGLLILSAVLIELGLIFARALLRDHPNADRPVISSSTTKVWSAARGIHRILQSRYLLGIAAFLVLLSLASTVVYIENAGIAKQHFGDDRPARIAFFAWIDFGTQGLTILLQAFGTARLLRAKGVGVTLAVMPVLAILGFVALGGLGLAGLPLFGAFVAFNILLNASKRAFLRPAREVLFTTVDDEERYAAKNFLDTAVYRGADVGNAYVHSGLRLLGGTGGVWLLAAVPMTLWFGLSLWLGRAERRRESGSA